MCICCTLFPGELIKIRVRRALNVAAFCQNKQRLLVIGFTLREVFKTTPLTKTSCRRLSFLCLSLCLPALVRFYWPWSFRPGDGFAFQPQGTAAITGRPASQRRVKGFFLLGVWEHLNAPLKAQSPFLIFTRRLLGPVELSLGVWREGIGGGALQQMFLQTHCV